MAENSVYQTQSTIIERILFETGEEVITEVHEHVIHFLIEYFLFFLLQKRLSSQQTCHSKTSGSGGCCLSHKK